MKKVVIVVIAFGLLAMSLGLTGCAAYTASPALGLIYTDVKANSSLGDQDVGTSKVGKATVNSYLGLIATGDASIKAAMDNAGITKIHHVDFEATSILGIVATYTVVVYGE